MTVDELKNYRAMSALIKSERDRLETLHVMADVKSSYIDGMPRASGIYDRIGQTVPQIVDVEAELNNNIAELIERKQKIDLWLMKIGNLRMRCALTARYVDGLKWQEVADRLGGNETEYSIKNAVKRYLIVACEN